MTATLRLLVEKDAAQPPIVCLDANALLDIWEHELASAGAKKKRKHPELVGFLARMRSSSHAIFVTPHIIEEVFHVILRRIVGETVRIKPYFDEKEYRRKDPSGHAAERKVVVEATTAAVAAAKKHGARVALPTDPPQSVRNGFGERMFEAFMRLLSAHVELGGKDAMHIVTASMLECSSFVSRDGDFKYVKDLIVFVKDLPQGWTNPPAAPPAPTDARPK